MDAEKIPLTEADTASYDSTAQMLKAAMAYVNPSLGKMMAVMAKSIELQHMVQYLNQGGIRACGVSNRSIPPEEVLRDLRKYCGSKEKEQLDRCLNLMNMAKMYEMYRNFSGPVICRHGFDDVIGSRNRQRRGSRYFRQCR